MTSSLDQWSGARRRAAVYGAGEHGAQLLTYIQSSEEELIDVDGVFDDRRTRASIDSSLMRGDLNELLENVRNGRTNQIIVALPDSRTERIDDIVGRLMSAAAEILVFNGGVETQPSTRALDAAEDTFRLPVDQPISGWQGVVKSLFDRVAAGLALLVLSPVFLLIAIAVSLESKGSPFFLQQRYGLDSQLFTVYKFRTIFEDQADENAETLVTKDDSRVTRLGHFLRRYCLDELPQLLNVAKGDMSLVGPRPHALRAKAAGRLYQDVVPQYWSRHRVRPGITGWAQVNGWRGSTDTEEQIVQRVEHDLQYIRNWSLALDIRILLKTIGTVLRPGS